MINFDNLQQSASTQGNEQLNRIERVPLPHNEAKFIGKKTLDHLREMQAMLDRANANTDAALSSLNDTVARKVTQLNGSSRHGLFRR